MVARCTRNSRARSAALFRPEPRPSRISAFCSGVSFGCRPPFRPRAAAAFSPARVRSRTMARSNSAKEPSICLSMRPAGPEVSIASVSERKRAPTASTLSRMCSRSLSERDRRSSFHTTSGVARPQLIEQAVQLGPVPAPARRLVLEHALAPSALERTDLGGGILAVVRLGNPCIAEQHGPVSHFPVANELTLATGFCAAKALVDRFATALLHNVRLRNNRSYPRAAHLLRTFCRRSGRRDRVYASSKVQTWLPALGCLSGRRTLS